MSASNLTDHDLDLLSDDTFGRLFKDITSNETLLDLAELRLKRMSAPSDDGESLPGHERGRDYIETIQRNGCTDEGV